jgi:ribosomal protein S18 acetylase RimI-like enzyme
LSTSAPLSDRKQIRYAVAMGSSSCEVVRCPNELRPQAIKWLHEALPADQRSVLTQAVEQAAASSEDVWHGLFIAKTACSGSQSTAESFSAAIWIQPLSGNTAYLWCSPGNSDHNEALLRAAAAYLDTRDVPLAQMVVGADDGYSAELLTRCGFPKFAELRYLYADASKASHSLEAQRNQGAAGVSFSPFGGEQPWFAELIEQTYIDSRDCPGLDGVRLMAEVLEGYRAQGRYSPRDWYIVQENGRDVGVLILAEHPEAANWELVYMGVIPDARGRGLGEQVIRFALNTVAANGGERLVAAVDHANEPALRAYFHVGFFEWDRRLVYARLQPRT